MPTIIVLVEAGAGGELAQADAAGLAHRQDRVAAVAGNLGDFVGGGLHRGLQNGLRGHDSASSSASCMALNSDSLNTM